MMRLSGLEEQRVTGLDRRVAFFMANDAAARDHVIKLPLRAVGVVRIRLLSGRNAKDLDVERMTLHQIGRERIAPQRL